MQGVRLLQKPVVATARIFGNRLGDGTRTGYGYLKRKTQVRQNVNDYFMRDFISYRYPEYEDERHEVKMARRARRERKGKPPVAKGFGKRAGKRKK